MIAFREDSESEIGLAPVPAKKDRQHHQYFFLFKRVAISAALQQRFSACSAKYDEPPSSRPPKLACGQYDSEVAMFENPPR